MPTPITTLLKSKVTMLVAALFAALFILFHHLGSAQSSWVLNFLLTLLLVAVNGICIWRVYYENIMRHSGTKLPVLLYLFGLPILLGVSGACTFNWMVVLPTLFILTLWILFSNNSDQEITELAFQLFLLIGLGALLTPYFLLLTPIYWTMVGMNRTVSHRSYLASILGLVTPFWLLWGASLLLPMEWTLSTHLAPLAQLAPTTLLTLSLGQLLPIALTLLFTLFAASVVVINNYQDRAKTGTNNRMLTVMALLLTLMMALYPQQIVILFPMLQVCSVMMLGHYFNLCRGRGASLLFLLYLFINLFFPLWSFYLR